MKLLEIASDSLLMREEKARSTRRRVSLFAAAALVLAAGGTPAGSRAADLQATIDAQVPLRSCIFE